MRFNLQCVMSGLILSFFAMGMLVSANAAAPQTVNYQGRLTDSSGVVVPNGSYTMVFTIYDAAAGGSSKWTETQSVSVSDGLFAVVLGFITPIEDSVFNQTERWLGVKVDADPEMTPRIELTSVGYSSRVQTVDAASGGSISGKVAIGPGSNNSGTNSFAAGENNSASGDNSVAAGKDNTASGEYTVVAGGWMNIASGGDDDTSLVVSRSENFALTGPGATIAGGVDNIASGNYSSVGGGHFNRARGLLSVIAGGGGQNDPVDSNYTQKAWSTVGGGRANASIGGHSTVSGGSFNAATAKMATVSGGTQDTASGDHAVVGGGFHNVASGQQSTIAGGHSNVADTSYASVGGGQANTASGIYSTIAGGSNNRADSSYATIGGGILNIAQGFRSTISGGESDTTAGQWSTVPGGRGNKASGDYSLAAGRRAKAINPGTFVWADDTDADFTSTADDQFIIRAGGNVGINTNNPTSPLTVAGEIRTTSGGIRFPDNTLQTTAATGGGGANGWTDGGTVVRLDTSTDSVGIGTSSPTEKLDVSGNIHASGTISSGNTISIDGVANTITSAGGDLTIGTSDNNALEVEVNGTRAIRVEPNVSSPNIVGGFSGNSVTAGVAGATVGGGGASASTNRVTDDFGTIGGGYQNTAGDNAGTTSDKSFTTVAGGRNNTSSNSHSSVGGGLSNTASGSSSVVAGGQTNMSTGTYSTVGGGLGNISSGSVATIAGGQLNIASGNNSSVGGGENDTASGIAATVPGGERNKASGDYSFAAGRHAKALHSGTFVWADGSAIDFASTAANQFLIRADKVGIGTNTPAQKLDVAGTAQMTGFKLPTGASTGFVLTSDATGVGTWQAAGGGGSGWSLTGNSGTTPGTNFVGTSDNVALELKVNSLRAFRIEPNATSPNVIGGFNANSVTSGVHGAAIGGGGTTASINNVTAHYGTIAGGVNNRTGNNSGIFTDGVGSTVGGGSGNIASQNFATIGGGIGNAASGLYSTVGGGQVNVASGAFSFNGGGTSNTASGYATTVGGGGSNTASGYLSTIGGGAFDTASGSHSVIPGGRLNKASGDYSFAAGRRAKANHHGSFVWADSTDADFATTADNQFLIRANRVGIGLNNPSKKLEVAGSIKVGTNDTVFTSNLSSNSPLVLQAPAGSARMYISDVNGNVGIGNSSPAQKLDVTGTAQMTGFKLPTGASNGFVLTSDASGVGTWQAAGGGGGGWSLTGNSGTTPGTNFVGTSDNVALEFKVNSLRAFRIEPNATSPNILGGYSGNTITSGVLGATIGGGGSVTATHEISDDYGTISGGYNNQAGDNAGTTSDRRFATVGGGQGNIASGEVATIGGGWVNSASASHSTVGGGLGNISSNSYATVGGGGFNRARGFLSVVSGGGGSIAADSNSAQGDYSVIGGGKRNIVGTAGDSATISGGTGNFASGSNATVGGGQNNSASGPFNTIGGGRNNTATNQDATVAGGSTNSASSNSATVGGGAADTASGPWSTVGGGIRNHASAAFSTIGGGSDNYTSGNASFVGGGYADSASGLGSTVPGGSANHASGNLSFAAGYRAKANHLGSFVLSDSSANSDFTSSSNNQFNLRAAGGTRIYSNSSLTAGVTLAAGASTWAMVSDSTLKRNIRILNGEDVLGKLMQVPIKRWSYKAQDPSIEHIGPMAQDFYNAFGLGEDDKTISTIDPSGVALAAIQGLYQKVQQQEKENARLRSELSQLKEMVRQLAAKQATGGNEEFSRK